MWSTSFWQKPSHWAYSKQWLYIAFMYENEMQFSVRICYVDEYRKC